jgi:hypothetical protein
MEQELQANPNYQHLVSLARDPSYLQHRDFRVKFLRAEQYNARNASIRMIRYLELGIEAYATSDILRRPIRLSDLTPNAHIILKEGGFVLMPGRDPSGRRIACCLGDVGANYSAQERVQMGLYLWQCVSDDYDTQILGCVLVQFFHKFSRQYANDIEDKRQLGRLLQCLPVRLTAIHVCLPDSPWYHCIMATYMMLCPKSRRHRHRIHVGASNTAYIATIFLPFIVG